MMDVISRILREINELTLLIEFRYPELYRSLEETPLKYKNTFGKEVDPHALYDYLTRLKAMVAGYDKAHINQKPKNNLKK
jgi:hypothetical protein